MLRIIPINNKIKLGQIPIDQWKLGVVQVNSLGRYSALDVAQAILYAGSCLSKEISHLHLQKLLYFSHAFFLVQKDIPLIKEVFEAWPLGPVSRSVYEKYQGIASLPSPTVHVLTGEDYSMVERVVTELWTKDPFELVKRTHVAGGPWDKAFDSNVNAVGYIGDSSIKVFYG